jgi:dTDP-4-dehydrorhamnose reductase
MKIMITGAAGFVGTSSAQSFSKQHEVFAFSRMDLDLTDRKAVREMIREKQPDLIINCAVIAVDVCENEPSLAEAVNVDAPQALAEGAAEIGAEIIHFSTNYVFDGNRDSGAYTQKDPAEPINIYGKTKLEGERRVQAACERSYILRTSWVFGPLGKNFLTTGLRNLKNRVPVRAAADIFASATYIEDLLRRMEEILARRQYGVYHTVNEGTCSHHETAMEAARLLGLTEEEAAALITPIRETEMKRAAARPRYTPMQCLLSEELGLPPMRSWKAALAEHLEKL